MNSNHHFELDLAWNSVDGDGIPKTGRIIKNHSISIVGKSALTVSAAKAFRGDPALYNPEDLLLASLTSCHMMSYLYCCAQAKVEVLAYHDHAEAILEVNPDGSGRIIKVILNPIVQLADATQEELALGLHIQANKLCFIANSCNFSVEHHPTCSRTL